MLEIEVGHLTPLSGVCVQGDAHYITVTAHDRFYKFDGSTIIIIGHPLAGEGGRLGLNIQRPGFILIGEHRLVSLDCRNGVDAIFLQDLVERALSKLVGHELRAAAQRNVRGLNSHRFVSGEPQPLNLNNGRADLDPELFGDFLAGRNDLTTL